MEMFIIQNAFKNKIRLSSIKSFLIITIILLILSNTIPALQTEDLKAITNPSLSVFNNTFCIVIYPNGGEEIWNTVSVSWEVYNISSYALYSKVFLGDLSSGFIKTDNGVHRYSFNTLELEDGRYKVKVRCYVDTDKDNIPEKLVGSDESDDFFTIVNGPRIPEKPSGVTDGRPNVEYYFSSLSTHPANKQLKYKFSWGDGLFSNWIGPYDSGAVVSASHSWSSNGTYIVKVKSQDSNMKTSDWSTGLSVTIYNNKPDIPSIFGPSEGKIDTEYSFNIQTYDQDEDNLYYKIDWDDGKTTDWFGPYESGDIISINHSYKINGSYMIKIKAKDSYNAESEWGTHIIRMSKMKNRFVFKNLILYSFLKNIFLVN